MQAMYDSSRLALPVVKRTFQQGHKPCPLLVSKLQRLGILQSMVHYLVRMNHVHYMISIRNGHPRL
jgi:hypothetical protein